MKTFDVINADNYVRAFVDGMWFTIGHFCFEYAHSPMVWLEEAHGIGSGYVDVDLIDEWEI